MQIQKRRKRTQLVGRHGPMVLFINKHAMVLRDPGSKPSGEKINIPNSDLIRSVDFTAS